MPQSYWNPTHTTTTTTTKTALTEKKESSNYPSNQNQQI